jgi:micrococcal nuclease
MKNMFKKVTLLILALLMMFGVMGCNKTTTTTTTTETTTSDSMVSLPDLMGANRETITETLEDLGLTVKYYIDVSKIYESEDEYDKFVRFGQDMVAGTKVELGTEVRVYTTPLHLETKYYNNLSSYDATLQLEESDYLGKEFIADGYGVVTVEKFVDGDTTWFRSGSQSFSVRYLGIDTPESTALYEPWGKTAAKYTEAVLKTAETIVLQSEGTRQDGNGRYLAWVWYRTSAESDFILLNLELVELAYSKNKVAVGSIYTTILTLADWDASMTKRRVWGEIDPNYDYSKEGTQMSIQYLLDNFDDYVGLKVVITGTITRKVGNSVYLQDETGYGVFMYGGFTTSAQLQVGANVTIGALTPTYYNGSPQLSNFSKTNLSVNEATEPIEPVTITYDDFAFNKMGLLVTIENLLITGFNSSKTSIYVKDNNNNTFTVRIDDSTGLNADTLGLTVGVAITVTGPLSYYDYDFDSSNTSYVYDKSNYQLMLTTSGDLIVLV